ncbi:transmembrane protein 154 [Xenentodon cancila]
MRGPQVKTPLPLLLLLLLLTSLTGTAFCEEDVSTKPTSEPKVASETESQVTAEGSGHHGSGDEPASPSTDEYEGSGEDQTDEGFGLMTFLIPAALAVVIIGMIVCGILIKRRCNKKLPEQSKEDQYLDGSSTDKVPMPMFEEDVPSVLELEMEELDQWMKKDCVHPSFTC